MSHDKIDDAMAINYESDLAHWKKRAIDAESALAAQQSQQGPKEPTEPVAMEGYWWCPNCKAEIGAYHVTYQEYHEDCGHKVEWITPDTAPLSGVRDGMLLKQALPHLKEFSKHSKYTKDGAHKKYDYTPDGLDELIEAITRAADQVNAEGQS